ncbi:serine/threonine-protein kinase [Sorangium cellulosum]|uniref:Protein kinase n=1 Tax=Sorangium cellulosum TaxID=56 RepID=A0A150QP63_SORCE|nr:serine/threonine-protein kinase [Sorangium cellulosum]KYF69476.1 protein kinase [Sorangium cellulosum]
MNAGGQIISANKQASNSLLGRYRLVAKLGRGGMADVFLAVSRGPGSFNKLVVVKCLRVGMAEDPRYVLMFLDEAKLSARLNHPNVIQTYEIGGESGGYFIVMEYLEGQPLKDIVRAVVSGCAGASNFTRAAWVRVIAETLRGLHYAHELTDFDGRLLGIVHRDVSPHNIFVTYDGAVKIVDFGVAKASLNAAHTENGTFKGKMAYAAPEQAMASEDVDRRADLFAIGIVLWELLAMRRLFDGDHVAVMHQLLTRDIPRLSTVVPDIDPALDEIVAKALQRDPARRFATAQEMGDALESYLLVSGEDVRKEQLGVYVLEMFAESRALVRQQVTAQFEYLSSLDVTGDIQRASMISDFPRASMVMGMNRSMWPSATGLPVLTEHSTPGLPQYEQPAADPDSLGATVGRPSPWRQRGYLFTALGAAALLGAGAVAMAQRGTLPDGGSVQASDAVPATTAWAPPTASAPLESAGPKAKVTIKSEPSDAKVTWNGTELGKTPLSIELPTGMQVVVVSRAGSFDESLFLQLAASDAVERTVTLRPQEITPGATSR